KTIRSCKKLTENFIGPFKITERVTNQTYRLDLKNLVGKIHDIFHVEKLEKAKTPQEGQQDYGMEWFVDDDESLKYLVDIIDSRLNDKTFEYRVLWSDRTTEWVENTEFEADDVEIKAFHNRNPEKPYPANRLLNRASRSRQPPNWYGIQ
ncbi:hypothetical protein K3495_g17087, partial [Podosphaera aphanis]